jgi:hypothetical protein
VVRQEPQGWVGHPRGPKLSKRRKKIIIIIKIKKNKKIVRVLAIGGG